VLSASAGGLYHQGLLQPLPALKVFQQPLLLRHIDTAHVKVLMEIPTCWCLHWVLLLWRWLWLVRLLLQVSQQ
jgi:hypothetical protein